MDALYDNIPNTGLDGEALDERDNPQTPKGFIKRTFEQILEGNLFTFHDTTYLQKDEV